MKTKPGGAYFSAPDPINETTIEIKIRHVGQLDVETVLWGIDRLLELGPRQDRIPAPWPEFEDWKVNVR